MDEQEIIALVIALLVMALGCVGSVVPLIPGTPIILIAAIGHKLFLGPKSAGWFVMTALVGLAVFSTVLDYLASMYGAKSFGATRKGMAGAVVGLLIGLFFNLPGILLGPFIGAGLFEMFGGREFKPAMKAGLGATLGLFAGALGKFLCCVAMITLFTVSVLWHSLRALSRGFVRAPPPHLSFILGGRSHETPLQKFARISRLRPHVKSTTKIA